MPASKQVKIKVSYVYLSDLDLASKNKENLGFFACGEVIEHSTRFDKGDMVLILDPNGGHLRETTTANEDHIIKIPDIDTKTFITNIIPILTAQFLISRTIIIKESMGVLIHNILTPTNQILAKWCIGRNVYVIGTVEREEDTKAAKTMVDCHEIYGQNINWQKEVMQKTKNMGLHCVFNSVDDALIEESFNILMPAGLVVLYDKTSFSTKQISIPTLAKKSSYITAASFFDYKLLNADIVLSVDDAISIFFKGNIKLLPENCIKVFNLKDIDNALKTKTDSTNDVVLVKL